jgi:hypothetical protein
VKIVYLYDIEGWALHNIGKLIKPSIEKEGATFELVLSDDFHKTPYSCDVLYLSFSFLYRPSFSYHKYASSIISTLHDPIEVSNFTNTFDWVRLPLRPISPGVFDRVSVISRQMLEVLQGRMGLRRVWLTPTFPHDIPAFSARQVNRKPVFFSTTNAPSHYSLKQILGRLRYPDLFTRDEKRRLSLRQLSSFFVRTNRKNIPWMQRIRRAVEQNGGQADFRWFGHPPGLLARPDYLVRLAQSDVYVCTSYMEGGPLTVMEAVKSGLAVLTTPVGQVSDWVFDGYNGYVSSSIDELCERAREYCRGHQLAQHQENSRRLSAAKEFDAQPWIQFIFDRPSEATS